MVFSSLKGASPLSVGGAPFFVTYSPKTFGCSRNETTYPTFTDGTAGSQQEPAKAESVTMHRVNYRLPEDLPTHQRDFFPPREPPESVQRSGDGSGQIALLVGLYLLAMSLGLAALVRWTPVTVPNTAIAEIVAGR